MPKVERVAQAGADVVYRVDPVMMAAPTRRVAATMMGLAGISGYYNIGIEARQ